MIVALLFIGAFGLAFGLTATSVFASHDDLNTIHACVYTSSGYTQILPPGEAPNCRSNQYLVDWQNTASFDDLEARIDALATENSTQNTQISDLQTENATQAGQISNLQTQIATQATQISDLETGLAALSAQVPDCLSEVSGDAVFSGCNVQVNNGEGSAGTKDGTGNLIVGCKEGTLGGEDRTGSHNLVIGKRRSYSS